MTDDELQALRARDAREDMRNAEITRLRADLARAQEKLANTDRTALTIIESVERERDNERREREHGAAMNEQLQGDLATALASAQRLLKSIAPQCEPLDSLGGVLSQIDNWCAGARASAQGMRAALEDIANPLVALKRDAERDRLRTQVATLEADLARANAAYRNVREIEDRLRLEAVEHERRIATLEAERDEVKAALVRERTQHHAMLERARELIDPAEHPTWEDASCAEMHPCDLAADERQRLASDNDHLRAEVARLRAAAEMRHRHEHNDTCSKELVPTCECDCGYQAAMDALTPERAEDGRDGDGN